MEDDDVRKAIEAGLRDAEEGRLVSVDEVRARFGLSNDDRDAFEEVAVILEREDKEEQERLRRYYPPLLGLIPAAGRADRLGPLPCSKELLPIGFRQTPRGPSPKVAGHYLLERFRAGGIGKAFMVLHESKVDVPRYFGTGEFADVALAYLMIPGSRSVPETLDRAFPFVEGAVVALGFPDVIFQPVDAYARLVERQAATAADLVLGLFPTERFRTTDMVELAPEGRVVRVEVRPESTTLRFNWLIAVWGPAFTRFLHEAVQKAPAGEGELQIGAVVQCAVEAGLHVEGVEFPDGSYRDVGTPAELAAAMREHAQIDP